jgi:hypothetical protein
MQAHPFDGETTDGEFRRYVLVIAQMLGISSSKAVSIAVLVSAFNSPPGPVNATP